MSIPAVFWLDAHWSGGETARGATECPVLGEIAAIRAHSPEHAILVDDAALFLAPPPAPHRREDWPDIQILLRCLNTPPPEPYVVVFRDVLIAVPQRVAGALDDFCRSTPPQALPAEVRPSLRRRLGRLLGR